MKKGLVFAIFILYSGLLLAQIQSAAILPADVVISNYLTGAEAYSALYSGKMEVV
jgi:hypothetical protein